MHVGDRSQLSSTELGELVQVPEEEVRRKMHFWLRMGVVIEVSSSTSAVATSSGSSGRSSRPGSPRPYSTDSVVYRSVEHPYDGAFKPGSALSELDVVSEQQFEDEDAGVADGDGKEGLSKEYLDTLEKYVTGV